MRARSVPWRFVMVDDHGDLRDLMRQLLEPVMDCVGEASDGAEAIKVVRETKPDLVILDLSMPDMDGLEALREIRRTRDVRVLVFSGFFNERLERVVLAMGASKLLSKSAPVEDILEAAKEVAAGDVPPVTDAGSLKHARLADLI